MRSRRFRRDPNAPPKAARGVVTTHCQICERDIKIVTAGATRHESWHEPRELIAHHGFQRPGTGWQSASCEGARELPWEISCDVLKRHVEAVAKQRERTHEQATGPVLSLWLQVAHEPNFRDVPRTIEVTEATLEAIATEHADFKKYNRVQTPHYTYRVMTWPQLVERYRAERAAEVKALDSYLTRQRKRLADWKPAP